MSQTAGNKCEFINCGKTRNTNSELIYFLFPYKDEEAKQKIENFTTMPGKQMSIYEYDKQIAAAFKVDCEEILEEFEKFKSFRFSDFAKVWQLKNFTFVFSGQKYALFLREVCENYFYIVKKFLMLPGNIFAQIGAFYLLYGLYYKQPLESWVKIRLTLEEFRKISELMEDMKRRRQFDPVYIYAKMKTEHAFVFTALPKPLGPEERFVKSYETYLDFTFSASRKEDTLVKFNDIIHNSDLIKDMEKTNGEYQELMRKYGVKCPSLTPFVSTIMEDLQEAYTKVQKGESSQCTVPSPLSFKEEKVSDRITSIKNKAMSNKRAVYRGNRKVTMGVDIDVGDIVMNELSSNSDDSL